MDELPNEPTVRTPGSEPVLRPEERAGFTPLKLAVEPGRVHLEITQRDAVVGRHTNADIRLAYGEISRQHCRFTFQDGRWRVIDMNSTNGVWVNGERMQDAVIYDGDCVRVGFCELTVERGTPLRVAPPPRKSDPELQVLQRIADVLPRKAG